MSGIVVAAAQSASVRGDLERNVARHLQLIEIAASVGAGLIVFPELSLTGYELDLAGELQLDSDDARIEPLRRAANEYDIYVLAGAPQTSGRDRPHLGAFLFSPAECICYAKIHVHQSEEQSFAAGKDSCVVSIDGARVGVAICADTSHWAHAADAAAQGAELYVASVMKTEAEYPAHADRLSQYAARHGMAVLTANYAGSTGGASSAGKSAFWDERGELIVQAGPRGEALVVIRKDGDKWIGEVMTNP